MKDLPEFVAVSIKGVAWMLPMFILAIRSLIDLRSSSGPDHEASSYLMPVVLVAAILPIIAGVFHRSRAVAMVAFGVWALLAILCFWLNPGAAPPTEL